MAEQTPGPTVIGVGQQQQVAPTVSDEVRSKLLQHINAKWSARTCPFCNAAKWEVGGWAPVMVGTGPFHVVIGGTILPSVALVCTNCGFTVQINALVAGLGQHVTP